MSKDPMGDRMKAYERCSESYLTRNMPVVIRVDGRAFHTLTRQMNKPFDMPFIEAMQQAACDVASDLQGFKFGYVQSDEASFVITDYDTHETEGHFGYRLQKIVSVTAARMSVSLCRKLVVDAVFDCRAFNVPKEDVVNCILWRMRDWCRNSVQMAAQAHFSHKELHKKGRVDMLRMLDDIGNPWDKLPEACKNGTLLIADPQYGMCVNCSTRPEFDAVNTEIGWLLDA